MAKKDKDSLKPYETKNSVSKLMDNIQSTMGSLYKNTYFTNQTNDKDLFNLKTSIDGSIDNLVNNVETNVGTSSISKVYSRIATPDGTSDENLETMFSDQQVMDDFMMNLEQVNSIKEYDADIDEICRYMPMLESAIDAKKDNVLSADHFSKDFLHVVNKSNINEVVSFNERIEFLKDKYNLIEFIEDAYYDIEKYGERFIYAVPYKKALAQLLDKQAKTNNVFSECVYLENTTIPEFKDVVTEVDNTNDHPMITLKLNKTGIIESAILENKTIQSVLEKNNTFGFDDKIVPDNTAFEGIHNDGFINAKKSIKDTDVKVPGIILKKLERAHVIPLYIENICLGYYYIESGIENISSVNRSNSMMNLNKGNIIGGTGPKRETDKNMYLRQLANKMSSAIDINFINSNHDITEDIYTILKYNELYSSEAQELKVTFLPPEDVIHMYLKKDQITKRGISGLHRSILPAKLYTSVYLTDTMGILTRSHDKRVYYVKQTVDTNISKVLLNTINQIKKSNFGARELTSAKNMLNIVGKFNDYVIPVGQSGPPVEFEVMQGQDIQIKTELLDLLEQSAIDPVVPYDYMQSRKNVDYAVRLTMSNGKFIRKTFKEQALLEKDLSKLVSKMYNFEFEENDQLTVTLPPPTFLNLINTNQIMQSSKEYVQSIIEMEFAGEEDQTLVAHISKKLHRHYIGTSVDAKAYDTIEKAKLEYQVIKKSQE